MKKFLSVISLLLVATMLMAIMPMSVFAEDTESLGVAADFAIANRKTETNPNGISVYNVPGASVSASGSNQLANIDGVISAKDPWYGNGITVDNPSVYVSGWNTVSSRGTDVRYDHIDNTKFTYYVAQDADYYYVGYEVYTPVTELNDGKYVTPRHNTYFGIGFDLGDSTKYLQAFDWTMNDDTSSFEWTDVGYLGWRAKNNNATTKTATAVEKHDMFKYHLEAAEKDEITNSPLSVIGESVTQGAKVTASNGNTSTAAITYYEMAISKTKVLADLKTHFNIELTEAPQALFIAQANQAYIAKVKTDGTVASWESLFPVYGAVANNSSWTGTKPTMGAYFPSLFILDSNSKHSSTYGRDADYAISTLRNSYTCDDASVQFVPAASVSETGKDQLDKIDGVIKTSDPWYTNANKTEGKDFPKVSVLDNSGPDANINIVKANSQLLAESREFTTYFAQDERYIYGAYAHYLGAVDTDGDGKWDFAGVRDNNITLRFGFDLDNATNYYTVVSDVRFPNGDKTTNFNSSATNLTATQDGKTDLFAKVYAKTYLLDSGRSGINSTGAPVEYNGTVRSDTGGNTGSPTVIYFEFAIDKEVLKANISTLCGTTKTDYEPNAFFIAASSNPYGATRFEAGETYGADNTVVPAGNIHVAWGSYYTNGTIEYAGKKLTTSLDTATSTKAANSILPALVVFDNEEEANRSNRVIIEDALATTGVTPHFVGSSTIAPNITDGKIGINEYTYSYSGGLAGYTDTNGALSFNLNSLQQLSSIKASTPAGFTRNNKTTSWDDVNGLINSESIRYYFTETDDKYYVAIENVTGRYGDLYGAKNPIEIRIGFDPTDMSNYVKISSTHNWETVSPERWVAGTSQFTSACFSSDAIENVYVTKYAETSGDSTAFDTDRADNGRIDNYSDYILYKGDDSPEINASNNGWTKRRQLMVYEIVIDKEKMAVEMFGEGATKAQLPNTMFFTVTTHHYGLAYPYTNTTEYLRLSTLRTGVASSNFNPAVYGANGKYFPDVVVFGTDYEIPGTCTDGAACNFVGHGTTYPVSDAEGNNKYYHTCTVCGAKGASVFTFDGTNVVYDIEKIFSNNKISDATCYQGSKGYTTCTCGEFDEEKSSIFEADDKIAHIWSDDYVIDPDDATKHYKYCTVCNVADDELDHEATIEKQPGTHEKHNYVNVETKGLEVPGFEVRDCVITVRYYKTCEDCGITANVAGDLDQWFESTNPDEQNLGGHVSTDETQNNKDGTHSGMCERGCSMTNEAHFYSSEIATDAYVATYETCLENGVYYLSCICGASTNDDDAPEAEAGKTFTVEATDHNFTGALIKDTETNYHYQLCSNVDKNNENAVCGLKGVYAEHIFDQAPETPDEANKATDATCAARATYYKLCACGAVGLETYEVGENGTTHNFTGVYKTNTDFHWRTCVDCGKSSGVMSDHAFDGDDDTKCNVCNYTRIVATLPGGGAAPSVPEDTTPADTTPADTTPVDTTPVDTTPVTPDTEPEVTTEDVVDTAAPVESEEVTAPVESEVQTDAKTEAPATTDTSCSGTVSVAALALVAALGTCATFVARKKED